jgi:FKBP-type peptidyl-prolyl cis-trans isomerase SlyD
MGRRRAAEVLRCWAMQIGPRAAVTIEYTLKDDAGKVLDTSEGRKPLTYLHGLGNLVPGLEKALEGKEAGASFEVTLTAEEGYGPRDEKLVRKLPLRKLADKSPQPGRRTRAQFDDGLRLALVTAVSGDYATVDGNHALAGMALHFAVKVVEVRPATSDELEHGHAHGEGGHHH